MRDLAAEFRLLHQDLNASRAARAASRVAQAELHTVIEAAFQARLARDDAMDGFEGPHSAKKRVRGAVLNEPLDTRQKRMRSERQGFIPPAGRRATAVPGLRSSGTTSTA